MCLFCRRHEFIVSPPDENGHNTVTLRGRMSDSNVEMNEECKAKLEEWVAAKRARDFVKADELRAWLRSQNFDPDLVRPAGWASR